jgi:hypothetical protein
VLLCGGGWGGGGGRVCVGEGVMERGRGV